jgi:dTDP-4-dehydrorhamnose 3,5-epimerase
MIEGTKVKKLRVIPDERGRLMEMLRADDPEFFIKFGQVYVSTTYPNVVKAWHYHKNQLDNFACVQGMVKLVLYDSRENSPTRGEINEFYVGVHNPILVQVPKLVYHGWMCVSTEEAIVINCTTEVYNYKDPDEYRVDPHDGTIPYDWQRKDR